MVPEVNAINALASLAVGLPANSLTIWMILKETPAEMRVYSQILLLQCTTDIAFLLVSAIAQPVNIYTK
jgi:hypothetical protein